MGYKLSADKVTHRCKEVLSHRFPNNAFPTRVQCEHEEDHLPLNAHMTTEVCEDVLVCVAWESLPETGPGQR